MPYATGLTIKKKIIKALQEKPMSLRKLETHTNTGYTSIKRHCEELAYLGIIVLSKEKRSPENGRPYTKATITKYGMSIR